MSNILDLCSDGCLLLLKPVQLFKVKCLMCYISKDVSTQKRFTCTQPLYGKFLLFIHQLKEFSYLYSLGVAYSM